MENLDLRFQECYNLKGGRHIKIISKASTDLTMLDCGAGQFSRHPAAPILNPTTDEGKILNLASIDFFENENKEKAS